MTTLAQQHVFHPNPVGGGSSSILALGSLWGFLALLVTLGFLASSVVFAFAVSNDAATRKNDGQRVWFLPPFLWFFAILPTNIFGALAYWLMHNSRLARGPESAPAQPAPEPETPREPEPVTVDGVTYEPGESYAKALRRVARTEQG